MPEAVYRFPKNFLWGSATAAHQVEGNNTNNNWYYWENQPGKIVNNDKAGLACDWWGGRWKNDLENAAQDGQNSHRFSVEWSRIQPAEDSWDEDALAYYREMAEGMTRMGLKPMVTLHHFTDPLWIFEEGGWENDRTVGYFADYVRQVVSTLKDYVDTWVTINEPAVYTASGYLDGAFPPGKNDLGAAFKVMKNLIKGHAAAYRIIHEMQPQAMVGIAKHFRAMQPARWWFLPDIWITRFVSNSFNDAFSNTLVKGRFRFALRGERIPEAVGTQDFVGINYYSLDKVVAKPFEIKGLFHRRFYPQDAEISETGFIANLPEGIFLALDWARRFKLPIFITENGVEDSLDKLRPNYLVRHLHQVWHAANFNWNIKGYYYWTQVDNFEWERGWTQRFGLWHLNVETQERIRHKSADLYAKVCRENALRSETVRAYAPDTFDLLFPT